jgi:hypothetical protein
MCGQLPFDDLLFGVADWLFRAVERIIRIVALLFLASEVLVPAFDGVDAPCEAAMAAPLPTVSASAAAAARSVRFGLRIDTPFRP